jgi:hypothetical protein
MTGRRRTWLIVAVAVAGLAMIGLQVVVYALDPRRPSLIELVGGLALLASLVAFVLSGAVILVRRPGNVIGWLLLIPGLAVPATEVANRWLLGIQPPPTELTPLIWLLAWWAGWSWILLIFPIFHLLLVFPSGRLLTPRWRLAVALEVAMVATMLVLATFSDTVNVLLNGDPVWGLPNPIGVFPSDSLGWVFGVVWGGGLVSLTVLSGLSLALRFRRGTGDERQQLKWPLFGALVFGLVYAGSAFENALTGSAVLESLLGIGLAAIPVSVAIAVLRYRLYEIDRLVSRTISWTLVTGILLLTFVIPVIGLQALVSDVTQGETLIVALSTLIAAALFQRVRGRVQRAVDRRFDRSRYDGERVVAAFGERLREHVDLDTLSGEVRRVADDTVRPSATAIWLRTATNVRTGPIS